MKVSSTTRNTGALSDQELVRTVQRQRDSAPGREAAEELFARYRKPVYMMCYAYVRSHERALDVSQDALLRAYERIGTFDGRSDFSCWLFAIARNRCMNVLRSIRLWEDDGSDPDYLPDSALGPDGRVEEREDEDRLLELIRETLEPVEQKALWLRCFEKVTVDEITRMLDIESPSGARAVLQRARRKLRAAMKGR